jgi:hypothetical protein
MKVSITAPVWDEESKTFHQETFEFSTLREARIKLAKLEAIEARVRFAIASMRAGDTLTAREHERAIHSAVTAARA